MQLAHAESSLSSQVHRITNRLGWHRKPTKDPEETRVNLESWLPQELHKDINVMLVGLGQTICLPVNPRCDLCHLGQLENSPCPSKRKVLVKQAKKRKEEDEERPITSSGQIGPIADTELEVEQSDVKPLINVKVETATGPLDRIGSAQTSPYFDVKKEDPSLAW
jgi:endonuclease-3